MRGPGTAPGPQGHPWLGGAAGAPPLFALQGPLQGPRTALACPPAMRRLATLVVLGAAAAAVAVAVPAHSQESESQLRGRIEASKQRERELGGAVARLGALVATAQRQVDLMEGRLARVQSDLAAAQAQLVATQSALDIARRRVRLLRWKLTLSRAVLARQLVADYKGDKPDVVSVVFRANGFTDLLNRVAYARRISRNSARIVGDVRSARDATRRDAARLAVLERRRRATVDAIEKRRRAIAAMAATLRSRRNALAAARAARAAALAGAAAGRRSAEQTLSRLLAQQAAAGRSYGPWMIPSTIVQCESGGQNLPPNYAGASGYYQFMPATWRGLGGSTPQAYQASKSEQDRLAARLWAGGTGSRNWVCAGMVG
jgi:septal ring factor EnvC (AmiA/AmiB activator)